MKLVFDTNILLDYYIPTRDTEDNTKSLIDLTFENNLTCLVPSNIANDFFYIAIRELKERKLIDDFKMGKKLAWAFFEHLSKLVSYIGCDESDIFVAEKMRNINDDLEDNLIAASVIRADANYLVTNDKSLLKKQLVPTKTPKQIIELINKKNKK